MFNMCYLLFFNIMNRVSPALLLLLSADGAAGRRRRQTETLNVTISPEMLRMLKQTGTKEKSKPGKLTQRTTFQNQS